MHLSVRILAFLFVVTAPFATGAQAAADPLTLELPADVQTVGLGSTLDVPVVVTAGPDFDGTVTLGLDVAELTQASPAGRVEVVISPQVLELAPGDSKSAWIRVKTDTMAPSFEAVNLGVSATAVSSTATHSLVLGSLALAVRAVFEIRLFGGSAPEKWDSPPSVSFKPHAEGVLIRFINMDTRDSHVIHSTGPIPHGDTGNPLKPAATQGEAGGTYEFLVTGTQKMKDIYYCHEHEDGSGARILLFNQ